MKDSDIEASMANFENLIYALLKDPVEKAYFFQVSLIQFKLLIYVFGTSII